MTSRYLPNDITPLLTAANTQENFTQALETLVKNCPPLDVYHHHQLSGLWSGPTGIAYLLLHVAHAYPGLRIASHRPTKWVHAYLKGTRQHMHLESRHCGIASEALAHLALLACTTRDLVHVHSFLAHIPNILQSPAYPNELLYGRAGTLYLLRLIRHWLPASTPLLAPPIAALSSRILADAPAWTWHGKRYLGAAHGDVGILTQLCLATPSLAPALAGKLDSLLALQREDGNWHSSEGREGPALLTQFCHGAPGFVLSLLSIRDMFPEGLRGRIDAAVERGRGCIWRKGLLRKEPSLCHGIFGNALALPSGSQRDHFMALATPEMVEEMRSKDMSMFEPSDYGAKYSILAAYTPSAAWAWMMQMKESPTIIGYNDI